VFAINHPTAVGSDLAARQSQRQDLFVVGVNGSPDAVNAFKERGSPFAAPKPLSAPHGKNNFKILVNDS
jgi:ribose transport system substrate-binding protein